MADDKKNIPDAGKVDEPTNPGKVEPAKAAPPVQDQTAPAKAEAPVVEDASPVVTPPLAGEQPAPAGKEAPKDKDAPAPSKEGMPPGKDEKQTTIPGMEDPAPAGKVVDFTAARDGATKGKPPEKAVAQDKDKQADKAKDAAKPRRGRPPKADKLTARGLAYVLRAIGRKIAKHHRAKQTPHGKQSVKKLMAHGASASSIELSGDKTTAQGATKALKVFLFDNVVEESRASLEANLEEFPALALSIGEKLLGMLGLSKQTNLKML